MTIDFASLVFLWLLPLTANSSTVASDSMTTHDASSLNPLSEVSSRTVERTTNPSSQHSLPTTPTMHLKTLLPNIQTKAAPNDSITSRSNSSTDGEKSTTEGQFRDTTASGNKVVTSQTSNPTTTTPVLYSTSKSSSTGQTSTFPFTSDDMSHPSKGPAQTTHLISTTTTFSKPVDHKSTSKSPFTGPPPTTQHTGSYKTSTATSKTALFPTTKANKNPVPQDKNIATKGTHHGKAVAGLIGGALVFMMVGFLIIYVKKRRLQRQQITTADWAGPSPFLEGGAGDDGQVTFRSPNLISLSSFLPQRLSKRLSLLPEMEEELQDMASGTTFGQELNGNGVQEANVTAGVVSEKNGTGGTSDTVENFVSVCSEQAINSLSTDSEFAKLS